MKKFTASASAVALMMAIAIPGFAHPGQQAAHVTQYRNHNPCQALKRLANRPYSLVVTTEKITSEKPHEL